jgi:lipopolysaccharide export LptBFGC system permease protein LptF
MANEPLKTASMPRRFTIIAAIFLGVIAASQAARAFYGFDMQVNGIHIPIAASWAVAAVLGLVAVFAFRESDG